MTSDSEGHWGGSAGSRPGRMADYVKQTRSAFANASGLGPRLLTKLYSMWVTAIYPFASVGKKISIHHSCDIRNPHLISLGNFVTVYKDTWLHGVPSEDNDRRPTLTVEDTCLI